MGMEKEEDNDVVNSLTSEKHMIKLCNRLQNQLEAVGLLYNYFDVNGKADELMKWAIQGDVAVATSHADLCNPERIAHKLISVQFCNDLGWKFFTPILQPVVLELIRSGKLWELKNPDDVKWLVAHAATVVKSMTETLDVCPLSIRESFFVLLKAVEKKFPDPKKLVNDIFFTKFICPMITSPSKYCIIGSATESVEYSEEVAKTLVNLAKLLESFARGEEINDEPCAPVAKASIQSIHSEIVALMDQLLNEKLLEMMKKVIQANIQVAAVDRQQARSHLEACYKEYQLINCVGLSLEDAREEMLRDLADTKMWHLQVSNKKKQIFIYSAQKPNDPIHMYKMVGTFKAPLSKAYDLLYPDFNQFISRSKETHCVLIERLKDDIADWQIKTKGIFPLAPRDMIVRMQMKMGNNEFWFYGSSINRPDYPPSNKCVRAVMRAVTYHVRVDKKDPSLINWTYLWHIDFGGKVPVFMMNRAAGSMLKQMESLHKYFNPEKDKSK